MTRLLTNLRHLFSSSSINFKLLKPKYTFVSTQRSFNLISNQLSTTPEEQILEQRKRNEEIQDMTELIRDFLDPAEFYKSVKTIADIDFYCGVPDSLLKDFCAYVSNNVGNDKHVITANEGNAVALASGYYMATGKNSLVYLQNSGLGNIVNPIMSLAIPNLFSIPMLLLVGWRGEPGKRDEPQHIVQGQNTPGLLAALGIPFQHLPDYQEGAEQVLATAKHYMDTVKGPYCLLVKRQTFLPCTLNPTTKKFEMSREDALKIIIDGIDNEKDIVVSSTGMISRELFEYRELKNQSHDKDFLTIGSMGHASSIAMGVSLAKKNRNVFCLDGDGSTIMHMGSMAIIGQSKCENLKHIIFNNGVHDSVGAQPTSADSSDFSFSKIALGCGYKNTFVTDNKQELKRLIRQIGQIKGPVLFEIKCNPGHRKNLGRPKLKPSQNRFDFMQFLAKNNKL